MHIGGPVLELLICLIFMLIIAAAIKPFTNLTRLPFPVVLVFTDIVLALLTRRFVDLLPPTGTRENEN